MVTLAKTRARPAYMSKFKPDSSCVLYLEGQQDGMSGTIKDLSGYGNHGTITGATWTRLPSGFMTQYFVTDDKVVVPTSTVFNTNKATLCAWIKPNSVGDGARHGIICHIEDAGTANFYTMGMYNTNLSCGFIAASAGIAADGVAGLLTTGWQFVHAVWNSSATVGRNGVTEAIVGTNNNTITSTNPVNIGMERTGLTRYFNGYIALPRIFTRDLSVTELVGLYQSERHLFRV